MDKSKRQYGFTLIELVVAVGVLAVVMAFSGVIFEMTAETRQVSSANSEIMEKFRTIKRQLDADFSGLRKDSPVYIWFDIDPDSGERFDEIMFFANGDFQSIQTYGNDYTSKYAPDELGSRVISGNTARVWYGHAKIWDKYDDVGGDWINPQVQQYGTNHPEKLLRKNRRILSRRRNILTVDNNIEKYLSVNDISDINEPVSYPPYDNDYLKRDIYEHDSMSLSQWQVALRDSTNARRLVSACMWDGRPEVGVDDPNTYHLMFSEGVSSFAVQWGYRVTLTGGRTEWRWFPSDDPDKTGNYSDFERMWSEKGELAIGEPFGVYFNSAGLGSNFYSPSDVEYYNPENSSYQNFGGFFPRALKFTFRIYDEKGVIEGGRKFSYIVYLD